MTYTLDDVREAMAELRKLDEEYLLAKAAYLAAARKRQAARAYSKRVACAVVGLASVSAVADAAGVTRRAVFKWMAEQRNA